LAEHQEDTSICLFSVIKTPRGASQQAIDEIIKNTDKAQNELLFTVAPIAEARNVPIYTKHKLAPNVETGIFNELKSPNPVRMVLMGWPSTASKITVPHNIIKEVLVMAHKDVGVFRDEGMNGLKNILVPIGNGPNARLAIKLAADLAFHNEITVTALRVIPKHSSEETKEDELAQIQEAIESELGEVPNFIKTRIILSNNVVEGIASEAKKSNCDLLIIGAAEEVFSPNYIFGKLNDALLEEIDCSILIVRRYEPGPALWFRQRIKEMEE